MELAYWCGYNEPRQNGHATIPQWTISADLQVHRCLFWAFATCIRGKIAGVLQRLEGLLIDKRPLMAGAIQPFQWKSPLHWKVWTVPSSISFLPVSPRLAGNVKTQWKQHFWWRVLFWQNLRVVIAEVPVLLLLHYASRALASDFLTTCCFNNLL